MSYYSYKRFFRNKKNDFGKKVIIGIAIVLITVYWITFLLKLFSGSFVLCSLIGIVVLAIYKTPTIIYYLKNGKNTFTQEQLRLILQGFTPRQFEIFAHELFKALGYDSYLMPEGPDGGKDIIVNNKYYVECKRYNSAFIGREICQKLLGAVVADNMEEGVIFTNGNLHENAIEFLKKTDKIDVWDFYKIYEQSISLKPIKLSKIIDLVANSVDEKKDNGQLDGDFV